MHKFSTRTMLIFVISVLLATALIGLGTAYMIQLKQRMLPSNPSNAVIKQGGLKPAFVEFEHREI